MSENNKTLVKETDYICPINGNKLMENSKAFFDKESSFVLWKNILGYTLNDKDIKELLSGGIIGPYLFTNKDGKTFNAKLKLDEKQKGKVSFIFENNGNLSSKETKFKCPITGTYLLENSKAYYNKEKSFVLWKTFFQHELTKEEINELLTKKVVGPIKDFVSSKTGKTFTAKLALDENYKVVLQFD